MRALPVVFSPAADEDMDAAEWWIAEQAGSLLPARRYGDRLRARCLHIGLAPLANVMLPGAAADVRRAVFERSATILYRVDAERVVILRILRAGRDVEAAARS